MFKLSKEHSSWIVFVTNLIDREDIIHPIILGFEVIVQTIFK